MLESWRVAERNFLEDVIDIEKHKNLRNPYEPREEKRRSISRGAIQFLG